MTLISPGSLFKLAGLWLVGFWAALRYRRAVRVEEPIGAKLFDAAAAASGMPASSDFKVHFGSSRRLARGTSELGASKVERPKQGVFREEESKTLEISPDDADVVIFSDKNVVSELRSLIWHGYRENTRRAALRELRRLAEKKFLEHAEARDIVD
ncbi:MAG TPA: hypothetical protein DF383_00145, partial [Deltaproteobacteria bacterium]|nr:hypothetical protein [Deltaproteobacteria bacterium]